MIDENEKQSKYSQSFKTIKVENISVEETFETAK